MKIGPLSQSKTIIWVFHIKRARCHGRTKVVPPPPRSINHRLIKTINFLKSSVSIISDKITDFAECLCNKRRLMRSCSYEHTALRNKDVLKFILIFLSPGDLGSLLLLIKFHEVSLTVTLFSRFFKFSLPLTGGPVRTIAKTSSYRNIRWLMQVSIISLNYFLKR